MINFKATHACLNLRKTHAVDMYLPFFMCLQTLKGHDGSVTVVDGFYDLGIIVSASTDSTMKIWRKDGNSHQNWTCAQTYSCPRMYQYPY